MIDKTEPKTTQPEPSLREQLDRLEQQIQAQSNKIQQIELALKSLETQEFVPADPQALGFFEGIQDLLHQQDSEEDRQRALSATYQQFDREKQVLGQLEKQRSDSYLVWKFTEDKTKLDAVVSRAQEKFSQAQKLYEEAMDELAAAGEEIDRSNWGRYVEREIAQSGDNPTSNIKALKMTALYLPSAGRVLDSLPKIVRQNYGYELCFRK